MSEKELTHILLTDLHRIIEDYSNQFVDELGRKIDPSYPPGVDLSNNEKSIFSSINLTEPQKSVLKIATKDLCAGILFELFSKMDGVSDPETGNDLDFWPGLELKEKKDESESEMIHDAFFERYWSYNESKT